jgi:hypothetical protein
MTRLLAISWANRGISAGLIDDPARVGHLAPPPDVRMLTATGLIRCLHSLAVVLDSPPPASPPGLEDPAPSGRGEPRAAAAWRSLVYRILEYHRRTAPDQVQRLRVALTPRDADLGRTWTRRTAPTDPLPEQLRDVDAVTLTGSGLTRGLETALYLEVRERLPDLAADSPSPTSGDCQSRSSILKPSQSHARATSPLRMSSHCSPTTACTCAPTGAGENLSRLRW